MKFAYGEQDADALFDTLVGPTPRGRLCPQCGASDHGRPWVEGWLGASVAHADGLTLVAVATTKLGVDLEPVTARIPLDVARAPGDDDRDPVLLWVAKEAALKAVGAGLQVDPSTLSFDGQFVTWRDREWVVEHLDVPGHVAVAVRPATTSSEAPEVPDGPASR